MTRHNPTTPIVMIGVMRGGFMFYNDLVREMQNYNVICDFVNCKSYDGVENTGFKMLLDSRVDVTDKHVYLVDDILDSGITYEYLKVHYEYKNARSVEGIFALKKYKPINMVAKQNCARLITPNTPFSQIDFLRIKNHPNTQCQNDHSIKLPS